MDHRPTEAPDAASSLEGNVRRAIDIPEREEVDESAFGARDRSASRYSMENEST